VQIATDAAKGACARLSGVEVPSFPDTETSFAELQERIAKTIAFVKGVDAAAMAGTEDKTYHLKFGQREMTLDGRQLLFGFALPNLYFHITAAYLILRHNGVEVGKMDYLGG
jgi:uncharacterized protein